MLKTLQIKFLTKPLPVSLHYPGFLRTMSPQSLEENSTDVWSTVQVAVAIGAFGQKNPSVTLQKLSSCPQLYCSFQQNHRRSEHQSEFSKPSQQGTSCSSCMSFLFYYSCIVLRLLVLYERSVCLPTWSALTNNRE